jgi:hypothetical protein
MISILEIIFVHFRAKNQNTSTKLQINSKFEISMTETSNLYIEYHIFVLNLSFGHWILFVICDLLFVFSGLSGLSLLSRFRSKTGSRTLPSFYNNILIHNQKSIIIKSEGK